MSNEIVEKPRQRKSVDYQNGKIYQIVNSINNKIYIGSCATELRIRFQAHKNNSNKHKRANVEFYDFLKDNIEYCQIILIENYPCNSKNELEKREYQIIQDKIKELGRDKLYNISISLSGIGHSTYGRQHTLETKQKISEKNKGKLTGEKSYWFGKHLSDETKQKLSNAKKGKYVGEKNPNYGKTVSDETKQKISNALIGKYVGEKSPNYGKTVSDETKQKLSEINKGKKMGQDSHNFKGGSVYIHKNSWNFQYCENGKQKSKSYSINKYGDEEAHRLCLEFQKTIYPELK